MSEQHKIEPPDNPTKTIYEGGIEKRVEIEQAEDHADD